MKKENRGKTAFGLLLVALTILWMGGNRGSFVCGQQVTNQLKHKKETAKTKYHRKVQFRNAE